jgi:hypothetical protein
MRLLTHFCINKAQPLFDSSSSSLSLFVESRRAAGAEFLFYPLCAHIHFRMYQVSLSRPRAISSAADISACLSNLFDCPAGA